MISTISALSVPEVMSPRSVPCRVAPPPPPPPKPLGLTLADFSSTATLVRRHAQKWERPTANTIDTSHPLHVDFCCGKCYHPFNSSLRQRINATRIKNRESASSFKQLLLPLEVERVPLTSEELIQAYQYDRCPHQAIALARATPDILYDGEPSNSESALIGSIIRWILSNDTCILKKDIVIVPKKYFDVARSYEVDILEEDTSLVDKLYSLRDQNPGRLLLLVPRKIDPLDWACIKSVIVYLACKNWELFLVQAPPKLSSSRLHYSLTEESLSYLQEDLDGMDADIGSRMHIATQKNNVYRGFWPMSLAAAHNPHVIFQWFGATPVINNS